MPLHNYPLVPIAIAYICGISFARYFFIPWWLCILIFAVPHKRIRFYLSILVVGYLFCQLSLYYPPRRASRCDFLKEHIRGILYYNMPYGEERNLLAGLILGERGWLSEEIIDAFRNTNTMHVLAISGMHIGFIGIVLVGVFRMMFISRKLSALLAIIIVLIYVSIVGWQPSAFRSAVMFCVFAMGWIIDRPSNPVNSLALAAIIILLITPQALFQAGFQLSFVIVLCLLSAVPSIKGIKGILWTSCAAWIGSLPLVAYHFKVISPISILANLIMVPGISLMIVLGFTSIFFGSIYIGSSGIFNAANYFLARTLINTLKVISEIPYGYFHIYGFPSYLVFISYLLIGIVFFSLFKKRESVVE